MLSNPYVFNPLTSYFKYRVTVTNIALRYIELNEIEKAAIFQVFLSTVIMSRDYKL